MAKNPTTITVSVLLLLALGLFALYTQPARSRLRDVRAQIADVEQSSHELQASLERLTALQESLPKGEVQRRALASAIPAALQQDRLLAELHTIAETHHITFDSLTMNTMADALPNVAAVSVASTFVGNYEDLVAFLKGLEQASRRLAVQSISVQLLPAQEGRNDETPRVSFSVTLEAYYQQ